MRRMRNNNLEIRIAGSSCHRQLGNNIVINLARAKSEALFDIYSFLKEIKNRVIQKTR